MPTSLFVFLLGFEAKIGKEKMVFHELVFSSTNFSSTNLLNLLVSRYIDCRHCWLFWVLLVPRLFCTCFQFSLNNRVGSITARTKYYFCRARLSKNISVTSSFKTFFLLLFSSSKFQSQRKIKKTKWKNK